MAKNGKNSAKNAVLRSLDVTSDTITPGANLGWVEAFQNLHQVLESFVSGDGQVAVAKKIVCRHTTTSTVWHEIQAVIVQTIGNFVDTGNLATNTVHEMLDSACDDDFSFQCIGEVVYARQVPSSQVAGTNVWGTQVNVKVPQNILQVLNKEAQTERLQNLHLGFVGRAISNTSIDIYAGIQMDFTKQRRNILIR